MLFNSSIHAVGNPFLPFLFAIVTISSQEIYLKQHLPTGSVEKNNALELSKIHIVVTIEFCSHN